MVWERVTCQNWRSGPAFAPYRGNKVVIVNGLGTALLSRGGLGLCDGGFLLLQLMGKGQTSASLEADLTIDS